MKDRITLTTWKWVAYLTSLFFVALFTAVIGVMALQKTIKAALYYNITLSAGVGIFVCFITMFLYIRYILSKDKYIECSLLKGTVIVFSTVVITILSSTAMYALGMDYAMPIVYSSLMVTLMLRQRLGIMSTVTSASAVVILNLISGPNYSLHNVLGITIAVLTGIFMIFLIRKGYNRFKLTWGTILVAISVAPLGFLIALGYTENVRFALKSGLECFMGSMIGIATFTIMLPIYEIVFRIWTDFKLAEVCSFNNPLLKKLREEASGTFNHSMIVSNLAENCAIAIGINPFMARACACFHDIGKIKNPKFFVENQTDGYNPHDELIPEVSANMITRHVANGAEILKEYKMPNEVIKAALEHHGDTPVMYFYLKAKVITEGELDMDEYRYDGPLPTTKYSAIIMICDVCEALLRTKSPSSQEELEEIVGGVIKDKMTDGQFDNCDLTINDMVVIKQTICNIIPTMLHKRIDYNKAKERR